MSHRPVPKIPRCAVKAARAALESGPWGTMRASERARIMMRFAELIRQRQDEIVMLESLDGGKPISSVRRQDYPAMLDCLEYYAGWPDKIIGDVVPVARRADVHRSRAGRRRRARSCRGTSR